MSHIENGLRKGNKSAFYEPSKHQTNNRFNFNVKFFFDGRAEGLLHRVVWPHI